MTETTNPAETSILGTVPVTGTFFQATQPVSGTVGISGSVAVTGPLTDAQLRATPVPISGTVTATIAANQSVNIAQVSGVAASVTNPLFTKLSDGAAAQGVVANPLIAGGRAATTNPTAVADAAAVNTMHDKLGKLVTVPFAVRGLSTQNTVTISNTTETTVLAAGAAGVFHDIVTLIVSNTSAGGPPRIDFRDTTGGAVRLSIEVPASSMVSVSLPSPIEQTTAAANWTAQLSSNATDIRIYVKAAKNL